MWPFDDPRHQIARIPPSNSALSGLKKNQKVLELEQRVFGLEQAVIRICEAINQHQTDCNNNFMQINKNFSNLMNYVLTPRPHIMGNQKDKN